MEKSIDVVRNHFSKDIYINEMYDRNKIGLKYWEKAVIDKYFNINKGKILNIGCGPGREAISLSKIGFDVVGIDISEKEIDIAKKESVKLDLNIEFKLCDGINLDFGNDYFDYSIIWAQTMGNIYLKRNRIKILKENKRVLKSKGILCFSVHDYNFIKEKFNKYTKGNRFYPYFESKCYWKLFTIDETKEMVMNAGFDILFCGRANELIDIDDTNVLVCICKKPQHCN